MKEIGRLITAMVTPFDEEGKVDYAQARKLASALLDSGSDGLLVVGTTGESPTLSWDEEFRLFQEIKQVTEGRGTLVAGTGSNSTEEALEATKKAAKMGVDACLLVVPYYNKPSQEGLYQHFKTIAEGAGLPCIMYNVPSRTVTNLASETVVRLSKVDNIIGVKEASANLSQIADIINRSQEGFLVWSGNDSDTFPIMTLGGYGVISVASHLVGKQIKTMIDSLLAGDISRAARIHIDLLPLVDSLFLVSNPCPLKYAMNQVGFRVGKPRLPLVEPDEKTAAVIRETLKRYQIDLPL
ncbi:MAG: 4-hydroxy-tetrahydrodipicolinate synthase [Dehalococcoidales bacterium]|jgi:4-hydroxy-tetrahydrodipicolinate synthase